MICNRPKLITIKYSVKKLGPRETYAIDRNMQLSVMHIGGADCIQVNLIEHKIWKYSSQQSASLSTKTWIQRFAWCSHLNMMPEHKVGTDWVIKTQKMKPKAERFKCEIDFVRDITTDLLSFFWNAENKRLSSFSIKNDSTVFQSCLQNLLQIVGFFLFLFDFLFC